MCIRDRFNGGTYDQWKDTVQQTVQQITTVSEADIDNALSSISEKSDAVNYNFYSSWKEAVADEGDFQGFGDFTMTESNKTMVMEQILNYTNRDLKMCIRDRSMMQHFVQKAVKKLLNSSSSVMHLIFLYYLLPMWLDLQQQNAAKEDLQKLWLNLHMHLQMLPFLRLACLPVMLTEVQQ